MIDIQRKRIADRIVTHFAGESITLEDSKRIADIIADELEVDTPEVSASDLDRVAEVPPSLGMIGPSIVPADSPDDLARLRENSIAVMKRLDARIDVLRQTQTDDAKAIQAFNTRLAGLESAHAIASQRANARIDAHVKRTGETDGRLHGRIDRLDEHIDRIDSESVESIRTINECCDKSNGINRRVHEHTNQLAAHLASIRYKNIRIDELVKRVAALENKPTGIDQAAIVVGHVGRAVEE